MKKNGKKVAEKVVKKVVKKVEEKNSKGSIEQKSAEEFDFLTNSASTTDCTGLMYRAAQSEEELENYQEVYQFLPPDTNI